MHRLSVLLLAVLPLTFSSAFGTTPAAAPVEVVVQGVDICLSCSRELKDVHPPKPEGNAGKVTVHQEGGMTVYEQIVAENPITTTLDQLEEQGILQRVFTAPVTVVPGGEAVAVPVVVAAPDTASPTFSGAGTLQATREGDEIVLKLNFPAGQLPVATKPLESTVRLTPGATLAIAGGLRESTSEAKSGVPVLRDLPLVGHWFEKKRTETTKQQFMLFVTAK